MVSTFSQLLETPPFTSEDERKTQQTDIRIRITVIDGEDSGIYRTCLLVIWLDMHRERERRWDKKGRDMSGGFDFSH